MKTTILHLGDIHIDAHRKTAGAVRIGDDGRPLGIGSTDRSVRELAKNAGRVDLYVIAGDLLDRPTPSAEEERAAVDLCVDLAERAPVVVVAGNHDIPSTAGATALECLKRRPGITVVETPTVLAWVHSGGRLAPVSASDHAHLVLGCVPYPRRAELASGGKVRTQDERNAVASDALRQVVVALKVQAAAQGDQLTRRVLCYHGSIGGAKIRDQPRSLSGDIVLDVPDLLGWDYVACGHIHQQQEIAPGIWYSGSPDRCGFGEEGEKKGALVVRFDQRECTIQSLVNENAMPHITLSPSAVLAGDMKLGLGTAYRIKGVVTPSEALTCRSHIANWQESGVWVVDALEVQREVRVRDSDATAGEKPVELLQRWLSGRPEVPAIAEQYKATGDDVTANVCDLHKDVEGGQCDR